MTENLLGKVMYNKINRKICIHNNILKINKKIKYVLKNLNSENKKVDLMAVVKNVSFEDVEIAIDEGIEIFGESRLKDLKSRHELYKDKGVKVHFIGHLQSNKVKEVTSKVDMIESVDSIKLAEMIGKVAVLIKKDMPILLEVNIGMQGSKFGFFPHEVIEACKNISKIAGVKIRGIMAIPPRDNSVYFFKKMKELYIDISNEKIDNVSMEVLSMGMSSDFEIAVANGSGLVRIGSYMFT